MLSIINHSVKIRDIEFLQFLYPDYIITDKLPMFSDNNIIWTGESKYINKLKDLGINYIVVSSVGEIDLNDRLTLLDVVFSKWKRKIPKYLLEFYQDLDDSTFREQIEYMWITGKWRMKEYDNTGAFLEFLRSFNTDTVTISKTYLQLLNKVGAEYIEMSLLTFLNRVVIPTNNISWWYKKVIEEFKRAKYNSIKPAITNYMKSPIYNTELRVFNFILDLNRRYQN